MNNKSILSFNSTLLLAFALCTSAVVTPPSLAETCMTDSLMMVMEPVETVKPRIKKTERKVSIAHHKVQSHSKQCKIKQQAGDTVIQASKPSSIKPVIHASKPNSTKQVAGKEMLINAGDAT